MIAQIIDSTSAGAASVERSVLGMEKRVEQGAAKSGKQAGVNLAGGVVAALASLNFVEKAIRAGIDARKIGFGWGETIGQSLLVGLQSIPLVGPIGDLIGHGVARGLDKLLGGSGLLPGEASPELLKGRQEAVDQQARQRLQDQQRRKEDEVRERILEENRQRLAMEAEHRQQQLAEEGDRRRLEMERVESEQRQERQRREAEEERRVAEEERRVAEQQREAHRIAAEQARRDSSVADAEGRLAGVVDSRGLSGRGAAFLQGRSQTQLQQDTVSALRKLIEVNLKQLEELQQSRFTVVGN